MNTLSAWQERKISNNVKDNWVTIGSAFFPSQHITLFFSWLERTWRQLPTATIWRQYLYFSWMLMPMLFIVNKSFVLSLTTTKHSRIKMIMKHTCVNRQKCWSYHKNSSMHLHFPSSFNANIFPQFRSGPTKTRIPQKRCRIFFEDQFMSRIQVITLNNIWITNILTFRAILVTLRVWLSKITI